MNEYFVDIAGRFPWPGEGYGRGFRIGDRAAIYARILHWRLEHPTTPLLVIDDTTWPECFDARDLTAAWLFNELSAEVRVLGAGEQIERPSGTNLYDQSLWDYWKKLRFFMPGGLRSRLRPTEHARARVEALLDGLDFGRPFIVVQPLFDARYNVHRNLPWAWWCNLLAHLTEMHQVVVVGNPKYRHLTRPNLPNSLFCWDFQLGTMESLALIEAASLFVGGETGLTLWAPILGTPTYGLFAAQSSNFMFDTAPISFGEPVIVHPLEAPVVLHVKWISEFCGEHHLFESPQEYGP